MTRAASRLTASICALGLSITAVGTVAALDLGSWSPPTTLSAAGTQTQAQQIALSADGSRATAVWHQGAMGSRKVQSAAATISGNSAQWSAAADLSVPGLEGIDPRVAVSGDGTRATAVWYYDKDGTYWVVQAASATIDGNNATWGPPVDLSVTGRNASMPDIGLSADGSRATVVWTRYNGSRNIVQSVSGVIDGVTASWSSPVDLSLGGSDALYPQVAMSQDGSRATAVWYRGIMTGTVQSASATVSGTNATWSGPVDLSAAGTPLDPRSTCPRTVPRSGRLAALRRQHVRCGVRRRHSHGIVGELGQPGHARHRRVLTPGGLVRGWHDGDGRLAGIRRHHPHRGVGLCAGVRHVTVVGSDRPALGCEFGSVLSATGQLRDRCAGDGGVGAVRR